MRRSLKITVALVLVAGAATGGYLGYISIRSGQELTLPVPTGPHPVGRTIVEWTDQDRTDPLAPAPGTPRTLSVWLWYPAAPPPGAGRAPYAPGAWSQLHLGGLPGLAETRFEHVHGHAFDGAPVAAGRFPVVVLEPGLGFSAPQYSTIAEDLASHGFLIAGVTPTYTANLTVLDGRPVHASERGNPAGFDAADLHAGQAQADGDRLVAVLAADARFAAAGTAALDAGGPFAGHVDATKTAYVGHSFGGAAALEACRTDDRCAGAADLDGTQYGEVVRTGLDKPMLLLGSEDSCVTGTCPTPGTDLNTARALLDASTAPAWCYQINGARHFNFSDLGVLYLAAPLRALLALGPVNGRKALTITGAYLAAFLGLTLRGEPQPVLTAAAGPYPEVVTNRTPS